MPALIEFALFCAVGVAIFYGIAKIAILLNNNLNKKDTPNKEDPKK